MKSMTCALLAALSVLVSGCGVAEQGQSSSLVTITSLQAARGSSGTVTFTTGPLLSDVCQGAPTCSVFDDLGQVTMDVFLKDPGTPTSTNAPSDLNSVTFTQFHVTYRRAEGRNTPGVDVPLKALADDNTIITTIADITFYGKDQAGKNVAVTGSIQVNFGNFADPS
jgi:hypothetical protein